MLDTACVLAATLVSPLVFAHTRGRRAYRTRIFLINYQYAYKLLSFTSYYADVPEWSNGTGLGPVSLALTQVRVLASAVLLHKTA